MSLSRELLRRYALKYVGALVLSSVTREDHLKEASMSSLLRRRVCVSMDGKWQRTQAQSGGKASGQHRRKQQGCFQLRQGERGQQGVLEARTEYKQTAGF